jgi:hypothetical protein
MANIVISGMGVTSSIPPEPATDNYSVISGGELDVASGEVTGAINVSDGGTARISAGATVDFLNIGSAGGCSMPAPASVHL